MAIGKFEVAGDLVTSVDHRNVDRGVMCHGMCRHQLKGAVSAARGRGGW